ncbi:MAG: thioredoxin domain-containing protein [Alphaproteobacteria bacterium]|nr:thioredoxin domain-containing protein [Alphaproteobacteria bacterium]
MDFLPLAILADRAAGNDKFGTKACVMPRKVLMAIVAAVALLAPAQARHTALATPGSQAGTQAAVSPSAAQAKQPVTLHGITVEQDDRTLGNPKAPVTFLEYGAPACPFCARFALDDMPVIRRDYIDRGKVFYIFRVYPLRAADGTVATLARCLPRARYFTFLEFMFRNQPRWDPDGYDIPDVEAAIARLARSQGIAAKRFRHCTGDERAIARLNALAKDGDEKYRIRGTPTFVVNGAVVEVPDGSEPLAVLRAKFEALLKEK